MVMLVMLYFPHLHGKKSSGPAVRTVGFFGQATGSVLAASSPRALKEKAKAASQALSPAVSNGQDP